MRSEARLLVVLAMALSALGGLARAAERSDARTAGERAARASAAKPDPDPPVPSIPKDARYTIYCATFAGPDHAQKARNARQQMLATSEKLRDWYIVLGNGQSTLYYGYYSEVREEIDRKEGLRAQNDRRAVASLRAPNGELLFPSALLVSLDSADPAAPPEWNLENARGYYTLQIAVYKDHPQRKEFAVAAVREARAAGHQAYFYHGPTASSVCIGVFPKDAVRTMEEVKLDNPNEVPMILPPGVNPPRETSTLPDGKTVRFISPKFEVLDPALMELMKKFPTHSVNGVEARVVKDKQGRTQQIVEPSRIVKVPRPSTDAVAGSPAASDGAAVAGPIPPPVPAPAGADPASSKLRVRPEKQQGGKLRSLDD